MEGIISPHVQSTMISTVSTLPTLTGTSFKQISKIYSHPEFIPLSLIILLSINSTSLEACFMTIMETKDFSMICMNLHFQICKIIKRKTKNTEVF